MALRLAYRLHLFHQLDTEIINEDEALAILEQGGFTKGNAMVVGNTTMGIVERILSLKMTPFSTRDSLLTLSGHDVGLERSESGEWYNIKATGSFTSSSQLPFFSILRLEGPEDYYCLCCHPTPQVSREPSDSFPFVLV